MSIFKPIYVCLLNRTTDLSKRMYDRNIPSHQLAPSYFARPVDTYATKFPILDCHNPSTVHKAQFPIYCQKSIFNPGQGAPFNGYAKNIDVESRLHNSFAPLQHCGLSSYIPSSRSDLYNANYLIPASRPVRMTNTLLFEQTSFAPFNPNTCNLGHKLFNNHIRIQTKNVSSSQERVVKEPETEESDKIKSQE